MRQIVCGLLLAFGTFAFAQQMPPANPPPQSTPPTFPRGQQAPRPGMPPDTEAPPQQQLSSSEVQQQIQEKLNSEPALSDSAVSAQVNDNSVVMSGTVNSEREHRQALDIAQSYAGGRQVLDRIEVKGRT
ncbi:MAG TPA: BON domain-containing protein [Terriglobales bacterium]|nr:BON domain-containing protein [Terriglobales bacterium]